MNQVVMLAVVPVIPVSKRGVLIEICKLHRSSLSRFAGTGAVDLDGGGLVLFAQLERGEMSTPETTGVEGVDVLFMAIAEGGPVAEENLIPSGFTSWHLKPGSDAVALAAGCPFLLESQGAFSVAVAQPRETIGDIAQALHA